MVTRNTALNELNFRGISINVDDSNTVTIVPSDSGVMFMNKNTSLETNYVLPAVADSNGKMYWFFNAQTTKNMRITAPTNTMVADNTLIGNYALTTDNKAGFAAFVIGDGSKYYLFELGTLAWTVS